MNFDQLANLIKAGFNEEQVRSIGAIMDGGTNPPTNPTAPMNPTAPTNPTTPTNPPAPTNPPTTPTTPGGSEAGAADGGTLPSAAQSPKAESETVTLLKEMLGLIQKGNINSVGTGAMPEQTGADVLAEILNPTPKTK